MQLYKDATRAFQDVINGSHHVRTFAQLERGGEVIAHDFGFISATVDIDRGASVRRTLSSMDLVSRSVGLQGDLAGWTDTLIPKDGHSPLAPTGAMIRLWRGVRMDGYSDPTWGEYQMFPQGLFRVARVDPGLGGGERLRLVGYDLSRTVSRNRFVNPYVIGAGTNYVTAVLNLVRDRLGDDSWPAVTEATVETTPLIVLDPDTDPWEKATEMAAVAGRELLFDPSGQIVIRVPVGGDDTPVWTYETGKNANLLGIDTSLDDEPGYNGVVLRAESTTLATPLRSEVWDDDATSPFYYLGNYGKVPRFITSPLPTTQAQCDALARTELRKMLGLTETYTFAAVPNPALEEGDTVRLLVPELELDRLITVERISMPMNPSAQMQVSARPLGAVVEGE